MIDSLSKVQPLKPQKRAAAVNICFCGNTSSSSMLILTKRAEKMRSHSGQISFPGGMIENHDSSVYEAALRETSEEIGIPLVAHELIGFLPEGSGPSGLVVYPVVTRLASIPDFVLNEEEVSEVLVVPVEDLMRDKAERSNFILFGQPQETILFRHKEHSIWGFTAQLIFEMNLRGREFSEGI